MQVTERATVGCSERVSSSRRSRQPEVEHPSRKVVFRVPFSPPSQFSPTYGAVRYGPVQDPGTCQQLLSPPRSRFPTIQRLAQDAGQLRDIDHVGRRSMVAKLRERWGQRHQQSD